MNIILKNIFKWINDKTDSILYKDDLRQALAYINKLHKKYGVTIYLTEKWYEGYTCTVIIFPHDDKQYELFEKDKENIEKELGYNRHNNIMMFVEYGEDCYGDMFFPEGQSYSGDNTYLVGPMPEWIWELRSKDCKSLRKDGTCDKTKNWAREFDAQGEPLDNYSYCYCDYENCIDREKVENKKEE